MGLWILLPTVSSAIYIGVVAFLLPKFFLQNKYNASTPQDRGIAKYKVGETGRAVTYQTSSLIDQYINQYILVYNGTDKYLKCKLSSRIDYIEYDVVLFNKDDEAFSVLSIQDIVEGAKFTRNVLLPEDTSYVSIVVTRIDDDKISEPIKLNVPTANIFAYAGISLLLSIFTAFAVRIGLVNFLGGVFREDFTNKIDENVLTLLLSIVLAVIGIATVAVILAIRKSSINKKARNR